MRLPAPLSSIGHGCRQLVCQMSSASPPVLQLRWSVLQAALLMESARRLRQHRGMHGCPVTSAVLV